MRPSHSLSPKPAAEVLLAYPTPEVVPAQPDDEVSFPLGALSLLFTHDSRNTSKKVCHAWSRLFCTRHWFWCDCYSHCRSWIQWMLMRKRIQTVILLSLSAIAIVCVRFLWPWGNCLCPSVLARTAIIFIHIITERRLGHANTSMHMLRYFDLFKFKFSIYCNNICHQPGARNQLALTYSCGKISFCYLYFHFPSSFDTPFWCLDERAKVNLVFENLLKSQLVVFTTLEKITGYWQERLMLGIVSCQRTLLSLLCNFQNYFLGKRTLRMPVNLIGIECKQRLWICTGIGWWIRHAGEGVLLVNP